MIRGLNVGVRRAVAAKLRERGFTDSLAASLAETHVLDAIRFFEGRLAAHQMRGKTLEVAADESFADLSRWAGDLAAGLPSGAVAP